MLTAFFLQLDSLTVEELDSKLKAVEQISDIFSEISQTVNKDYLDIQKVLDFWSN